MARDIPVELALFDGRVKMNSQLNGQTILITGSSSGVGFECAKNIALSDNCSLFITGRELTKLSNAEQEIQQVNPLTKVKGIQCNHKHRQDIVNSVDFIISTNNIPDVVIANVGLNAVHQYGPKHIHSTALEQFEQILQVNLSNTFLLLAKLLPVMKKKSRAMVILIGSRAYQYGVSGQVAYNVSKAGLIGLKNTIVSEYGRYNIACHVLNLGLIENQRTAKLRQRIARQQLPTNETLQFSTESDIASKIVSFISNAGASANGLEVNL